MKAVLSVLFIYLMMVTSTGLAAPENKERQIPPPLVKVVEVSLENAKSPEKYVGHVEAIVSIHLRARVEGYLETVNFQEGSFVQEGKLLYMIEQHPYKARVDSAKAKVIQAEADLFKAENFLRRLRSAQPESVSQTDLDDAKAARDSARGKLQEAKANLKLAEIDLDYTTIEAPMAGRIGKSFYKKGDLVTPSSGPLSEIVSIDPIRVLFSVSEKHLCIIQNAFSDAKNHAGHRKLSVNITFPDNFEYPQNGRIEFIDNKMDPDTGTIAVWALFDNPDGRLVPGEYVKVFVQSAEPDMQPAIPQVAVQRDRQGAFVFVVNSNNEVEKRRIQTGELIGDQYIVKSGLIKGETVIVQGIQKVSPGMTVKIQTDGKGDS
jgi:membrane fusion protein (multidrug efflux system)